MNNYMCVAKEGVDFCKYGFRLERGEYIYYIQTKRIVVRRDLTVRFNSVSIDIMRVFSQLVKDDVVYFQKREDVKTKHIILSSKEYDMVMELRSASRKEKLSNEEKRI